MSAEAGKSAHFQMACSVRADGVQADCVETIGFTLAGAACSSPNRSNSAVSTGRPTLGAETVDKFSSGAESAAAVAATMPAVDEGRLAKTASIATEAAAAETAEIFCKAVAGAVSVAGAVEIVCWDWTGAAGDIGTLDCASEPETAEVAAAVAGEGSAVVSAALATASTVTFASSLIPVAGETTTTAGLAWLFAAAIVMLGVLTAGADADWAGSLG